MSAADVHIDLRGRIAAEVGADRVEVRTGDLSSRTDLFPVAAGFAARHAPFRSLIHRRLLTPEPGASAALRLASDLSLATASGRYYVRDRETRAPETSHDPVTRAAACQLSLNWAAAAD